MHFPQGSSPRRQRDLARKARELAQLQQSDYRCFVQRIEGMVTSCTTKVIKEGKPISRVLESFNAKVQLCRNCKKISDYADNTVRHSQPIRTNSHYIAARAREREIEAEIVQRRALALLESELIATPGAKELLLRLMIEKGMPWSDAAKTALEICKLFKISRFVLTDLKYSI